MAIEIHKDGRTVSISEPQYTYGIAVHANDGTPLGIVHGIKAGDHIYFELASGNDTVIVNVDLSGLVSELLDGEGTDAVQVEPGKWKINLVVDPDIFEIVDGRLTIKNGGIDGQLHIKDNSITGAKLQDYAVSTPKLADEAVIEEKIKSAIDLRLIDGVAMIPYQTSSGSELKAAYLKAGSGIKFHRLDDGGLELYLGFDAGTILSIVAEDPLESELSGGVATISLNLSPRFAVDGGALDLALNSISSNHINDYVILERHIADDQIRSRHIAGKQIEDEHIKLPGLGVNVIEYMRTGTSIYNAFFEYGELGWERIGTWNTTDAVGPFNEAPSAISAVRFYEGPYDGGGNAYYKGLRNIAEKRFNGFGSVDMSIVIRVDSTDPVNDVEVYFAFWGYNRIGQLVAEPDFSNPSGDSKLIQVDLSAAVPNQFGKYSASADLATIFGTQSSEEVYYFKVGVIVKVENGASLFIDSVDFNAKLL